MRWSLSRSTAGVTNELVVIAPLGIANSEEAGLVIAALHERQASGVVLVAAGRPYLSAERAGLPISVIVKPRRLRDAAALVRHALRLRRAVLARGRSVLILVDAAAAAPYDALIKLAARVLGARELHRIGDPARDVEPLRLRPSAVRRIVAANLSAYRAARQAARTAASKCSPTPRRIQRLLYVRTDVAFASAQPGGMLSHTIGVLGGFLDNGLDVTVIGPRSVAAPGRRAPDFVEVSVARTKDVHRDLGAADVNQAVQPMLLARAPHDVDAIYTRCSAYGTAPLILARTRGAALIVEYNGSEARFALAQNPNRFERLALEAERRLCESATLVVAISERVADEVHALVPGARVLVAPNAVDGKQFADIESLRPAARAELNLEAADLLVGFFGRFYHWHGVDSLAAAAEIFLAQRPAARLLLVGDGPESEIVLRSLSGWGNRVIAPGIVPHDEVPRLMAACDILAAPHAPIEGFIGSPTKLFEYMASGRPVVASRLEQLAEIVRDGETGLLVTPGDVAELAAAILRLLDDAELRVALGTRARAEALRLHTWQARTAHILTALADWPRHDEMRS